jgi:hypothetical protein
MRFVSAASRRPVTDVATILPIAIVVSAMLGFPGQIIN